MQSGAYRYPFSILENRMVADFIMAHRNIAGGQSYHNAGGMILRGPGVKGDHYEPADVALVRRARQARRADAARLSLHDVAGADLYECYGCRARLALHDAGHFRLSRTSCFRPSISTARKTEGFGRETVLHAIQSRSAAWATASCRGTKCSIRSTARSKSAGSRRIGFASRRRFCWKKNAIATWRSRSIMPIRCRWSSVQSIDVKAAWTAGLTQVTAVISNERMLPTHAAVDVLHQITPPDLVTIAGPQAASPRRPDCRRTNSSKKRRSKSIIRAHCD